MRKIVFLMVVLVMWGAGPLGAAEGKLPVIDGQQAVATVNDAPISLEEFKEAISASHAQRFKKKVAVEEKAGKVAFSDVLNRLINARLIVLEARNMGLEELPEIKTQVESFKTEALAVTLLEQQVEGITVDEKEVERLYQEATQEWKIAALKFKTEETAREFETRFKTEGDFAVAARAAVEAGSAEWDGDREAFLEKKELLPSIVQLLNQMEVGGVSPVISAAKGSVIIFRLEAVRTSPQEDSQARSSLRRQVLNAQRKAAARGFYEKLRRKRAKIDETLLESLDYESDPAAFEKFLADDRVLVKVKKGDSITVGELSAELKKKFFHGVEAAIRDKRVNAARFSTLEAILEKRLLVSEALRRKVDRTTAYQNKVGAYENSLMFGAFVQKVLAPGVKLKQEELDAYYVEHRADYTSPKMVGLRSLAFNRRAAAQSALEKLSAGTDFNWLSAHAEGLLAADTPGVLPLDGKLLTLDGLPEDLHTLLEDVDKGDFRLFSPKENDHAYVLYVYRVVPSETQPFEAVKNEIAKAVYQERLKNEVQLWADKLRAFYPVEIFLTENSKDF